MNAIDIMKKAVKCADDKKANDIKVLDIKDLTTIADYFVICHGNSSSQMGAIFDEIEEKLKKEDGILMQNLSSHTSDQWLLMDYGDFIVHIFDKESRLFYGLEKLWDDAEKIDTEEIINEI